MKKLMIAAAIVCAAAMSQAAVFNWTTTDAGYGVDPSAVTGNGDYGVSSQKADRFGSIGTIDYTLTLYAYDTGTKQVGEKIGTAASGTVSLGTLGKIQTLGIDYTAAEKGTTYWYVLQLDADQTTLRAKESADYDYSNAHIATSIENVITTDPNGATPIGNVVPTGWTVSGVTENVPEPTSGLLLLLGVAGLALRRRRA